MRPQTETQSSQSTLEKFKETEHQVLIIVACFVLFLLTVVAACYRF